MATTETVKNALANTQTRDLKSLIESSVKELGRALPDHLKPERLVRIALTCVRLNPELAKCTPESFLGALFTSAQLGVEPIAGRAYILPFWNNRKQPDGSWKKILEAQFMMGYRGVADLFYRHEKAVQLDWGVVHKNDDFQYEYGTEARLKHIPAQRDRGPVTHYYVVGTLNGGGKPFMVMSYADCLEHGKKHSKTYDKKTGSFFNSSPWVTAEDSMCLKTVLIQLAKLLPLSVDLQRAIAADETSREYRRGIDDALDPPDNTVWNQVEAQANEKIEKELTNDAIEP